MTTDAPVVTRTVSERTWAAIAVAALATMVVAPLGYQWLTFAVSRLTMDQGILTALFFPLGYATTFLIVAVSIMAVIAGVKVVQAGSSLRLLGAGAAVAGAVQTSVMLATQASAFFGNIPNFPTLWF